MANKGMFIVVEGIDGAGTTTQVARLSAHLRSQGRLVCSTREPTNGPVGVLLRQILTKRLIVPSDKAEEQSPNWTTMALLFAADRSDHLQAEIEPVLEKGGIVISDRYDASSLAYQSAMRGADGKEAVEWIRTLNRYARRPDLTIVLDVPSDVASARRDARGEAAELYEQNEFQQRLAEFYRELPRHMPGDRIVIMDGTRSLDEVHERLVAEVEGCLD